MEDGPPRFPQGFPCPVVLRYLLRHFQFRIQGFHLLWPSFPACSATYSQIALWRPYNPRHSAYLRILKLLPIHLNLNHLTSAKDQVSVDKLSAGFGLFPVRSPLLRESLLISLPPGTEMFQFPGFAPGTHFTTHRSCQPAKSVGRKVSAG